MKYKQLLKISVVITLFSLAQAEKERLYGDSAVHTNIRRPRMIRGRNAMTNDWQFIVSLNFHQQSPQWKACGGALIKNNWVITAAHCIDDIPNGPQFVTVTIGGERQSTADDPSRTYKVVKIVAYNEYFALNSLINMSIVTAFNWDFDIALLKLERPVEHFVTVKLPEKNVSFTEMPGLHCKSAGWGSRKEYQREIDVKNQGYDPSSDLQEIDVPLVSKDACRQVHKEEVSDIVFCGGILEKEAMTSCIGDSGSPLVCKTAQDDRLLLAGIIIGGNTFCKTGKDYMMFTEVSKYRVWIDQNSRD